MLAVEVSQTEQNESPVFKWTRSQETVRCQVAHMRGSSQPSALVHYSCHLHPGLLLNRSFGKLRVLHVDFQGFGTVGWSPTVDWSRRTFWSLAS